MFERVSPGPDYETKASDISGSSTKAVLSLITGDKEYPPEPKSTAFAMSAQMRDSMPELPMSPDGSTLKQPIAVMEEAISIQNYRNKVTDSSLNALGSDSKDLEEEITSKLDTLQDDVTSMLAGTKSDMDLRFEAQLDENRRTNTKISALKQESNQLQRKLASVLKRLRVIEKEMEIPSIDEKFESKAEEKS